MKKKILIFLLSMVVSGMVFSQESEKKVTVGLGGEMGGGVFLIIPEIAGYVTVPINFSDSITLTPKIGFSYLFNVIEEDHTSFFIPIGVDFLFNNYYFGFSIRYFLSIQNITGEHWLAGALTGYIPFIRKDNISFFMQVEFGPALLIRPGQGLKVYTHLHPALCVQYFF